MAKIVSAKELSDSQVETFLAASSKEAQQQFFQLVGLCEEVHAMQETETILTCEEALLMATALQHEPREVATCMGFEHPDPFSRMKNLTNIFKNTPLSTCTCMNQFKIYSYPVTPPLREMRWDGRAEGATDLWIRSDEVL